MIRSARPGFASLVADVYQSCSSIQPRRKDTCVHEQIWISYQVCLSRYSFIAGDCLTLLFETTLVVVLVLKVTMKVSMMVVSQFFNLIFVRVLECGVARCSI